MLESEKKYSIRKVKGYSEMKKRPRSKTHPRVSKDVIITKARKRIYDRNPLLATPHQVVCTNCGCTQKVTYLGHLKNGRFELGKTEAIEVAHAAPTITGLSRAREMITPIIMRVKCLKCDAEISCSPVSLEYLLFTAERQQKTEHMYV